jgi:hypothetical protein
MFTGRHWSDLRQIVERWEERKSSKKLMLKDHTTKEDIELSFLEETKKMDKIQFFHSLYEQIRGALKTAARIVQQIRNRRWPDGLIQFNSISLVFEDIKRRNLPHEITEAQFLALTGSHALTYPVKDDCGEECQLQIVTFIPQYDLKDEYFENQVYVLPVKHQGAVIRDWHILKLPKDRFWYSKKADIALLQVQGPCVPSSNEDICALCNIYATKRPISDPCFLTIARKQEPWKTCPFEKTRHPKDVIVRLGQRKWAYADDTPGKLTERCEGNVTEYTLPSTGVIDLAENCTYSIRDNPITNDELNTNQLRLSDVEDSPMGNTSRNLDALEDHVLNHLVIYLSVASSLIGSLILGWSIYCYKKPIRLRLRRTRRANISRNRTRSVRVATTRAQRREVAPLMPELSLAQLSANRTIYI